MRHLVEAALLSCAGYNWEALKLSPHTHAAVPVRRLRVFYVGIRCEDCRVIQDANGCDEHERAASFMRTRVARKTVIGIATRARMSMRVHTRGATGKPMSPAHGQRNRAITHGGQADEPGAWPV